MYLDLELVYFPCGLTLYHYEICSIQGRRIIRDKIFIRY